jgi:tetratricopeptide (TPR) repeat protein
MKLRNKQFFLFISLVFFMFFFHAAFADTVKLSSGTVVVGEKLQKTDKYLQIEVGGLVLKFDLKDVAEINGVKLEPKPAVVELTDFRDCIKRGKLYFAQGKFDKALADFNQAAQLNPGLAEAYNLRGLAYSRLGNLGMAINDYNLAIRMAPANANAYLNRSLAYAREANFSLALGD